MRRTLVLTAVFCVLYSIGGWAKAATQTYSLDGVRLTTRIGDVISSRGKPQRRDGYTYLWENSAGGTTEVTTLSNGVVVEVDVKKGPHEVRQVSLPALPPQTFAVLGRYGHVNYSPPAHSQKSDLCEALGRGGNCESFTLPGWGVLMVDFGSDNALANGSLSEIMLVAPGFLDEPVPTATPPARQTFPGVAPQALVQANVVLTVSGCGAQAIRKGPIGISVWPANWFPGFGHEVASTETRNYAVFHLQPGYYRFMMGGYGCLEEMQWLALLPGHDRSATLHFQSFVAKPNVDYDIWYEPSGGLAGTIPFGANVVLSSTRDSKVKKPTVNLEGGLYYADRVPEGSYQVRATYHGMVATKNIAVKHDAMQVLNFNNGDFLP